MATTVARLEAILTANTRAFDQAMNRSETKMQRLGKVSKIAGAAVVGGIAIGLEKSVHAAMNAEVTHARLDKAFHSARLSADKYTKAVEEQEDASRKLGFTDNDTRNSLSSLIVSTGSYKDSVNQLAIAQDLARFKGVGLEQAVKALTMAHAGSLRPLKQLGLDIPKVSTHYDALSSKVRHSSDAADMNRVATAKLMDKQATFANVLDTVTAKTHGQANAYSQTAAGGMAQFHAQTEHLEETLGEKLLPALTKVIEKLNSMIVWLQKFHGPSGLDIIREVTHAFQAVWLTIDHAYRSLDRFIHRLGDLAGPSGIDVVKGAAKRIGDAANSSFVPSAGKFSGNLHGALPVMAPFAALGARDGLHITSGRYDHSKYTKHGTISDHWRGKAIDMADGPASMARFFRDLIGNPRVKQAFYDPLGSIFGGKLSSYREGGHSDHVHVATYDRGGFLQPGWNLAYNGLGKPEPVGDAIRNVVFNFNGPVLGKEQQIVQLLRNAVRAYERNNGRTAFGF